MKLRIYRLADVVEALKAKAKGDDKTMDLFGLMGPSAPKAASSHPATPAQTDPREAKREELHRLRQEVAVPDKVFMPAGWTPMAHRQKHAEALAKIDRLEEDLGLKTWQRTPSEAQSAMGMPVAKHRQAVAAALKGGKPVPAHVVAAHPGVESEAGRGEATIGTQAAPKWRLDGYSDFARQLARTKTRKELEREYARLEREQERNASARQRALDKTTSMTSHSQARAQTGNVVSGNWTQRMHIRHALEIHDHYPAAAKPNAPPAPPAPTTPTTAVPSNSAPVAAPAPAAPSSGQWNAKAEWDARAAEHREEARRHRYAGDAHAGAIKAARREGLDWSIEEPHIHAARLHSAAYDAHHIAAKRGGDSRAAAWEASRMADEASQAAVGTPTQHAEPQATAAQPAPLDVKELKTYPPGTTLRLPDGQRAFYRDSEGQWRDDDGIKRSTAHIAHMADVWDYIGTMTVGHDAESTTAPREPTAEERAEGRERLRQSLEDLREKRRDEEAAQKKAQAEAKEAERKEIARKSIEDAAAANEAIRQRAIQAGGAIAGRGLIDAHGNEHQIPFEDTALHLLSPSNPNRMTPEQVRAHHAALLADYNKRFAPQPTPPPPTHAPDDPTHGGRLHQEHRIDKHGREQARWVTAPGFDPQVHLAQHADDVARMKWHQVADAFEAVDSHEQVHALAAHILKHRPDLENDVDQAIGETVERLARDSAATEPPEPEVIEEAPHVTKTPDFLRWFGDWTSAPGAASKVRKANGAPAEQHGEIPAPTAVYHGTAVGGFDRFDPSRDTGNNIFGKGFYFTEDPEIAKEYTKKDAEKAIAQTTYFVDSDGREIDAMSRSQVRDLLEASGFSVENLRAVKKWSNNPRDYKSTGLDSRNQNWDMHVLAAVARVQRDDGTVPIRAFFAELANPTVHALDGFGNPMGQDLRRGEDGQYRSVPPATPHRHRDTYGYIAKRVMKVLGGPERASPRQPDSQVFEVYLNIRNPIDMDAPISRADFLRFAKGLQAHGGRSNGETVFAHTKHGLVDVVPPHKAGVSEDTGEYEAGWEMNYENALKYKRALVDATKGKADKKGRPVLGLLHLSPPDVLTWGDVHYLFTDAHHWIGERGSFTKWAQSAGYDGIRHTGGWNVGTKPHAVWIAWSPTQVKATTATSFDPADESIYKAVLDHMARPIPPGARLQVLRLRGAGR